MTPVAAGPSASRSICLEHATLARGGSVLLADISLRLPCARTVIIGPNGAGKTTLLQAIQGLIRLDSGRVVCQDGDGSETVPRTGLVFQRPVMLRRSVRANVEHALAVAGVPTAQRRRRAEGALADIGLSHLADRPAPQLSGGEQQRLAVVRAEALDPHFLLLDEPTASLDPAASAALERYLLVLAGRGRGLVLSTHDLGLARRFAEFVVFIHRGRVLEAGPAPAFFDGPRTAIARRFLAGDWLD